MNALFLGDSITHGFDLNKYFHQHDFVNQGISGCSSADLLHAINPRWFVNEPEVVFLCIGTNDLAREVEQADIVDNVKLLIDQIRAFSPKDCRIYLTSLFPTRHNPPRPNPVIDRLNVRLHLLAPALKIGYLELNPFFKDQNGQLSRSFTRDGLHLNDAAYKVWADVLGVLLDI